MSARRRSKSRGRFRDRIPERYRRFALTNPFVSLPLVILFYASVVALLSPLDTASLTLPALDSVARRDYLAERTFTVRVEDPAAVAQARDMAKRTPRVYRHDATVRESQVRNLTEAFTGLEEACTSAREERDGVDRDHEERVRAIEERRRSAPAAERAALDQELTDESARYSAELNALKKRSNQRLSDARATANARLGAEVSPISLEALEPFCFPEELRRKAASLLSWILNEDIVDQKAEVLSEIERGIDIARPGRDALEHIVNLSEITDRMEARKRVAVAARRLFSVRDDVSYFEDDAVEEAFVDIVTALVVPTTRYDPEATRAARKAAERSVDTTREATFQLDQTIVRKGQVVTPELLHVLKQMHEGREQVSLWRTTAGTALSVLLLMLLFWFLTLRHGQVLGNVTPRHLVLAAVILVAQLGVMKISVALASKGVWGTLPTIAYYYAMPLAVGAMLIRLFLGAAAAVLYSIGLTALTVFFVAPLQVEQLEGSAGVYVLVLGLLSSLVAAGRSARIRRRVDILQAGLVVALFNAAVIFGLCLFDAAPLSIDTALMTVAGVVGGLGSAFLVGAFAPLFEWVFGYTTNIKLLELASLNQPVLKRLILEAPGTYHHSFLVGNLVESAAETIGANPLLARVAALYHDLGKVKNPLYYGENQQKGENRHDKLQPSMSALVIRQHVKDSVRMAAEAGLGRDIRDIIEQHHGTTLVRYFYNKAVEALEEGDPRPQESDYRYPGPKPQSRAAGLVLLADSVEAAVRSLPEKAPARIRGTVRSVILEKFQDGQLDECDLTLRSLNRIEEIFTTVLQGVHHARPEYPNAPGSGVIERAGATSISQQRPAPPSEDDGDEQAAAEPTEGRKSDP